MEREHKLLPLSISLLAGLAVSVMMIVRRNFSLTSLVITLAVMLGFYIVGLIFRAVLTAFKTKEEPQQDEETDGESSDTVNVTNEFDSIQEERQNEEG
ncbi:MAG: hypothetical protein NC223_05005 [Butyrivibrio sp.]|nr:hypothetical protein [Butyrivibrio sp.]